MTDWANKIERNAHTIGDIGDETFLDEVERDGEVITYGELTFQDVQSPSYTNKQQSNASWSDQEPGDFVPAARFGTARFGESRFGEEDGAVTRDWTNQQVSDP